MLEQIAEAMLAARATLVQQFQQAAQGRPLSGVARGVADLTFRPAVAATSCCFSPTVNARKRRIPAAIYTRGCICLFGLSTLA